MKVQGHDNSLETNIQTESKEFGIGDASVVIEILRNRLYENKIQTLVQEYICNARDAMREVGKGNDFEITMPTRLAPTFKVRDFGPGITPERMDKVFRLYGASTKRGSNNQTGGFGIGAKSAWSYTDSFTVVTVVDGTRRTYVCHTGTNNQGSVDLITTEHTDESNGTEIQVAVGRDDIEEFRTAILRAIYFWEERPTVKNYDGELPALTRGYKVSDNLETLDRNLVPQWIGLDYYAQALAVIDGVPYFINEKLLKKAPKLLNLTQNLKKLLVLNLGNGLVEVSASRESIADSSFTVDALNKMGAKGTSLIEKHVKAEFAKVNSVNEWVNAYKALSLYFNVDAHSAYGDYKIQDGQIVSESLKGITMTLAHCLDKRKRYVVERISKEPLVNPRDRGIPMETLDRVFLVTKDESKVVQNKRLREFFEGKHANLAKVILLEYSGNPDVVDKVVADLGIKVFETLEYTVKPKAEKVKIEREHEEFCMHGFIHGRHHYTSLAKNENKYLYVDIQDGKWEGYDQQKLRELSWHLRETHAGVEIVGLGARALKMVVGDANFTPFKDWLATYKPTQAEVNFTIRKDAKNAETCEALLGVDGIEDEFLVEMTKEYKGIINDSRKIKEIPDMLIEQVKEVAKAKAFFEKDDKLTKLFDEKYPLVKDFARFGRYSESKKELAFYINAKYTN